MPQWGDPEHDWGAIEDCVEIMYERLGKEPGFMQAKEKFGGVRCYIILHDESIDKYRAAYEECVKKHPHIARYILNGADYPEHLRGIIKEEDCEHPCHWVSLNTKRCGVCGKEETIKEEK